MRNGANAPSGIPWQVASEVHSWGVCHCVARARARGRVCVLRGVRTLSKDPSVGYVSVCEYNPLTTVQWCVVKCVGNE